MKNLHKFITIALVLVFVFTACTPKEEPIVEEPVVEESPTPEPSPTPTIVTYDDEKAEIASDINDFAFCPSVGETMYFYPEYDCTWEGEGGTFNWYLPYWWDYLILEAGEPEDLGEVSITSIREPSFQYYGTMEGGECTLSDGIGSTAFSVTGYCQAGVVYLNIAETNDGWAGTIICPDVVIPMDFLGGDSADTIEFPFTRDQAGSFVEIPFDGGSGYRAFTLTTSAREFPPTPTPSEDDVPLEPIPTPEG